MSLFGRKKDKTGHPSSSASLQDADPNPLAPLPDDELTHTRSPLPTRHEQLNSDGDTHTNRLQTGEYAKRVEALLNLLNDLHDLRTTHFQLSIPSVAVIGNQSLFLGTVGLVQGKCPMRCEIRRTEESSNGAHLHPPWTAKISIEIGSSIDPSITRFRSFGPATILDPGTVELWILRAQAAILTPHLDPSVVIEYDGATPLTFIDLPGIVHNTPEGAPPDTPDVIRCLVKNHIHHSDTIILVTIPALDDFETQEAFKLAREVDCDNIRTLGVFTKSDLLQASSTNMMKRRLRDIDHGHRLDGGLGYFAVKLPDDSEREFGEKRIQEMEKELFETQEPWKNVKDRGRLGVKNLVIHVGHLLADLVDARLPYLKREVDIALAETNTELFLLPPEPDWSRTKREVKLHLLLASFVQEVQTAILASDSDSHKHMSLTQHNIKTYKQFAAQIATTKPAYAESPSAYWNHVDNTIRKCTTWELPGNTPYLSLKSLISEYTARWKDPSQRCFDSVAEKLVSYLETGLIENHFKEFPILQSHVLQSLIQYFREVTQKSIRDTMSLARLRLNSVLELEQRAPFYTLIQDDYVSAVATWKSNLNRLSGVNQHQHVLQIELMAKALAYYGISSKRFTDYVMLTLESELKQGFSNGLHAILLDSVSSTTSPSTEDLMAEDPVLKKRRVSLKERIEALDGILARLLEYDPDLVAASAARPLSPSPPPPGPMATYIYPIPDTRPSSLPPLPPSPPGTYIYPIPVPSPGWKRPNSPAGMGPELAEKEEYSGPWAIPSQRY
ncbi:P-loop containing nucleoside triphosphate hydrolase protein [Flagelloscypha sp. PMI_526]|nr:P-loop containing nucleoside triphosphate hydrolase protein [Flagelloscypha sp. PMI_526]